MEWKKVKLGDISTVQTGPFGSQLHQRDYVAQGTPCIMPYNIGSHLDIKTENIAYLRQSDIDRLSRYCVTEGDIIYSRRGDVEKCAYISSSQEGWLCGTGCLRIRPKSEFCNPKFIAYLLSTVEIKSWIVGNAVGTTMLNLNSSILGSLPLSLPSLDDQRRMAAILSSLDDKIENNNRINRNLEAQAQALFKSWFVDFEPWGGKMPEDWKFDDISNIPHILETGRRPKGGAVESGIPSIGAEHIKGMGTYDFSKTKYISEEYARSLKTGKVNGYELLIYKDGGKPGYFIPNFTIYGEGYPFGECYLNEHVLKLDFPSKAYNIFCYFYFQTPEVMNYLNAQGGKAAIPGINKSDIDNINILTPDNEAVVQFGDIVLPYFKTILRNLAESQRLAALRDTLLPKLMKGEIAL